LEISRSSGGPIDLQLDPTQTYTPNQFHVGTIGTNTAVGQSVPCYLAGTRIRTETGEMPVEQLRVGDRVITRDGSAKPIRWIGRRSYSGAVPAGLRDVEPVAIAAGALADGVPARELIVSPLHALYLDGVLVPAERLVNGRTIRRRPDIDPIRYFHIELERHDVLFAEGAPAESFVDCDSRSMFHNAAEYDALYPGEPAERWLFCAPRVESGEALAAIRRRLDERAGLAPEAPDAAPGPLLGRLDGVEAGRIAGWAFQPDRPDRPVWLEVLANEGVIARVEARRYRADLEAAGIGDGRHGFELNLTGRLGQAQVIRVRRVSDGAELDGSPLALRPLAADGLADEARRLVATAVLDPDDASTLDAFAAELLRGIDTLRQARVQAAAPVRASRRVQRRALIIDSALPRADRDAGSQAVLCHAAALNELGWQVEFVAPHALADFAADAEALEAAGYVVHRAPQVASVEEVLRRNRNGFELVYLHRLANAEAYAPLARQWQARARVIYSVADLHHLRVGRQADVQSCEELAAAAMALRVRETNAMRLADAVITHSSAEAAYLADLAPGAVVHVVPWVPLTRPSPVPFGARQGVACIGGWMHEPNVDAVRWLTASIMPLVWERAPRIALLVVGSAWPESVPWIADPRIRVVGQVGSLDPLLSLVRLTVAPLRFGAGLKGKVLDSFAAEVPVVMTPVAAEGLALEGAARGLVGEGAEALAALILRAHEDAAFNRAAGLAGRRLAETQFTADAVKAALQRAVARPGVRESGSPPAVTWGLTSPAHVRPESLVATRDQHPVQAQ
ncbi:MAG TPA: Hint domain-containing protein, partial [Acetobacteraceae bacterium]|nr:Hint domain-containing protein [Acetobacteraceae bacterium]